MVALTRALAKEHGSRGFRVNALLPGGIVAEGTRRAARGLQRLKLGLIRTGLQFKSRLPIGRPGRPDEVARGRRSAPADRDQRYLRSHSCCTARM